MAITCDLFRLDLLEPAGIGELLHADGLFVALDVIRMGPLVSGRDAAHEGDYAGDELGRVV